MRISDQRDRPHLENLGCLGDVLGRVNGQVHQKARFSLQWYGVYLCEIYLYIFVMLDTVEHIHYSKQYSSILHYTSVKDQEQNGIHPIVRIT